MSQMVRELEQLIVRAYARLKGLRDNVPSGPPAAPRAMVDDFNRALDDLKAAGYDLSDFRITSDHMERWYGGDLFTTPAVLRSHIDAVLIYFRIDQDPEGEGPVKASIGFEAPEPLR